MRRSALFLSAVLGLGVLTGCSGGGPYCDAIDRNRDTLTSFGALTDEAYGTYADVTTEIAEVAPDAVAKEWKAIAKATRRVVKAHDKAGIRLEDMDVEEKANALSQTDIDRLTEVYEAFADTRSQRQEVVEHAHDECGIDLSEK